MPISIPDALDDAANQAVAKSEQARNLPRYLCASALAGAYVGIAVVLLATAAGPFVAANSPAARLVMGAVFGIALTLVVFAGAELFTGNVMYMIQGLVAGRVRVRDLSLVWIASLVGNVVGSMLFAAMVYGAGTLHSGPGSQLIASVTATKDAVAGPQLFWRAVLCNMLVCLALWMATRTRSDAAKLAVLWWALLAFIVSGFEHSVANATLFSIGALEGTANWGMLARNLAWTIPGNIVGGGVVVGLAYAWIGRQRSAPPVPTVELDVAPAPIQVAVGD